MKNKLTYPLIIIISLAVVFSLYFLLSNKTDTNETYIVPETQQINKRVSLEEFEDRYTSGEYKVIDVRTLLEYSEGTVTTDPLLIDFYEDDFRTELNKLDKNQPYLIYCRSGNRSSKTLPIMKELGFKEVYELEGGKKGWEASGRTLVDSKSLEKYDQGIDPVECSADAKICPDGSAVGRTGLNCEFAECL